jgi:hypothetical protein
MKVVEKGVIILNEDDICHFLQDLVFEVVDAGVTLVYQEREGWPAVKKEVSPFGVEGYHAIVPVEIGNVFESVYLFPVKEGRKDRRKVIDGRVLLVDGRDLYDLFTSKQYELSDCGITFVFQKRGTPPTEVKQIKRFGKKGYHVIVPVEIGRDFERVHLVPGEKKIPREGK